MKQYDYGKRAPLWIAAILAAAPLMAAAQPATADESTVLNGLLSAIARQDHVGFIEEGTPGFAAITEEQFNAVVQQVGPRLEQGYRTEYFGDIRQQGYEFSVWKVSFTDGGDDLLATLNVDNGKVGGFYLR